jgi:hypothetical protein
VSALPPPPPPDEAPATSVVRRRLEGGLQGASRFSRYDEIDALLVGLPYCFHFVAELLLNGSPARAYGTAAAAAVGVWALRNKFPDGITPIIRALGMKRRFSSLAPDVLAASYPPLARATPSQLAPLGTENRNSPDHHRR